MLSPLQILEEEIARRDPEYFMSEVLGLQVAGHHREWIQLIAQNRRLCVMAPRDHSKTTVFSVVFPLWRIRFIPGDLGYIFSYSQDQASKILERIKDIVETNSFFQGLKPKNPETWHKSEIKCSNGAKIVAKGFGTSVRGPRPNWIICDDILADRNIYPMSYIKKFFFEAVSNMIARDGRIIVVGTPQSRDDLLHELAKNPAYCFRKYAAVLSEEEKTTLWPQRYSYQDLMLKKREVGSVAFAKEWLCEPVSEESSLFPYSLVSNCFDPEFRMPLEYRGPWKTYIGCDLALSAGAGADYTVFLTLGVDSAGNRYILDIFREKGLSYKGQFEKIVELSKRYRPQLVYVEANQYQRVLVDMLRDRTDIPVKPFITGRKKVDLIEGVPGLRVLFENGKIRIPRGDDRSIDLTDVLVRELVNFGWREGKLEGVGEHDDTVMALYIADQAVKEGERVRLSFGVVEM